VIEIRSLKLTGLNRSRSHPIVCAREDLIHAFAGRNDGLVLVAVVGQRAATAVLPEGPCRRRAAPVNLRRARLRLSQSVQPYRPKAPHLRALRGISLTADLHSLLDAADGYNVSSFWPSPTARARCYSGSGGPVGAT
jgi:hypothetical protein